MSEGHRQNPENHPKSPAPRLPLLIEVSLSLAKALVFLVATLTGVVSLLAGATLQIAALRSGVAILGLGWLLWLLNWMISRNSLIATLAEIQEKMKATQDEPSVSTTEKAA